MKVLGPAAQGEMESDLFELRFGRRNLTFQTGAFRASFPTLDRVPIDFSAFGSAIFTSNLKFNPGKEFD